MQMLGCFSDSDGEIVAVDSCNVVCPCVQLETIPIGALVGIDGVGNVDLFIDDNAYDEADMIYSNVVADKQSFYECLLPCDYERQTRTPDAHNANDAEEVVGTETFPMAMSICTSQACTQASQTCTIRASHASPSCTLTRTRTIGTPYASTEEIEARELHTTSTSTVHRYAQSAEAVTKGNGTIHAELVYNNNSEHFNYDNLEQQLGDAEACGNNIRSKVDEPNCIQFRHTHTHIYIYIYIYLYTYIYIYMCVCIYIHIYICASIQMCGRLCLIVPWLLLSPLVIAFIFVVYDVGGGVPRVPRGPRFAHSGVPYYPTCTFVRLILNSTFVLRALSLPFEFCI